MKDMAVRKPSSLWFLAGALILLSIGGLSGGYGMLADPSGKSLGLPAEILQNIPGYDFVLPGLFLFLCFGILPIYLIAGIFLEELREITIPFIRKPYSWIWILGIATSLGLMIWLVMQVSLIGFSHVLQVIYGLLAILILFLYMSPSIRKYYAP